VGRILTVFRSICTFSILKGALLELNTDMDCMGSVTAFEYVIPDSLYEATETGAALPMGACDGPPTMVKAGVGALGGSTTSLTLDEEGLAFM
jgi:hypothetical protein